MRGYAPITPRLGGNCWALPPTMCSVCLGAIAFLCNPFARCPAPKSFLQIVFDCHQNLMTEEFSAGSN